MKFVTLFVAGAAASLVPRAEVDMIEGDIETLQQAVQNFTTDISNYSEGNMGQIRQDSRNIILALSSADGDTKAMKGPLSDADASGLAIPIQDLATDIGKAMDALIAQKSKLVAGCHGPEIYQALMDQKMQTTAFQKDLMGRLSSKAQPLALQVAKPIDDNIAKGIAAFSDQQFVKCPASSTQSGGSSGSSSGSSGSSGSQSSGSSPSGGNTDTQSPGSSPVASSNGTSATYTGPSPTGTSIQQGAASNVGAGFGIAFLAALAVLAL